MGSATGANANDDALGVQDLIRLVERHAIGMWRFRWIALIVAWVLSLVLWTAVYMLPDRFEASAQVYVDTDSVLRPLLRGLAIETDVMNDVSVMTRSLVTRPHLERVAREADLDINAKTPQQLDDIVSSLARRINIATTGPNIYTISFDDTNRATAVTVVDKLLDSFVEDTLGSGQEDSQQAEKTLKAELDDYERRLNESEDRLKEFKRKNVGLMPDEHGDYYTQLKTAEAALATVEQSIRISNQKLASLDRQLQGEEPVFGIMSSPTSSGTGSSYDAQIAALEQKRNELLVQYTEKHPEVVRTEQMIADLKARRDAERAANPPSEAPVVTNPLDINPVYQDLKIQRNSVTVELAALRAEEADKKAKVDRLKKLVDVIPQVEAELNRLNRDYGVVKARYTEMLQRWEDLQTGKRVESGSDVVKFRIVNPPYAPTDPAGPPRALYLAAAFLFSLGVGLGLALLLDLLRPVYQRTVDLRNMGYPILGSIAAIRSPAAVAQSRTSNLVLAGAVTALVLCLGAVILLSEPGSRLLRGLV